MKNLIVIFTLLLSTYSYATVGETLSNTLDSAKVVVNNAVTTVDTSSNFKMIYSDIKDGIAALATGLKVGAEHVYTILVKQQIVIAITRLILLFISLIFILNWFKKYKDPNEIWWRNNDPTFLGLVRIFQITLSSILFSIYIMSFSTITTGLINPEYGAIEKILEMVNK